MANSSLVSNLDHTESPSRNQVYKYILQYSILVLSLIANSMLVMCLALKDEALSVIDKLMLNTIFCNVLLAFVSIPTSLVIDRQSTYPYGESGCRLINPFCTYVLTCCVFTYIAIAFERYLVVSNFYYHLSRLQSILVLLTLHVLGMLVATPYVHISRLKISPNGTDCVESWNIDSRKAYSLSLFVIQYGVPVPLMVVLYTKIWHIISKSNQHAAKCSVLSDTIARDNSVENDNVSGPRVLSSNNEEKIGGKSNCFSLTKMKFAAKNVKNPRLKQTRQLLVRFTIIMTVFGLCQLPNHILWLLVDFAHDGKEHFNDVTHDIVYYVTYANCVINPLIYGQYGRRFWKDVWEKVKRLKNKL